MKFVPILFLSIIQLVCYVEGWISYFLNCIVKFLSRILFLFARKYIVNGVARGGLKG